MQVLIFLALLCELTDASFSIPVRKILSKQYGKLDSKRGVQLYNYHDGIYIGQVSLGTPEQIFNVELSTMNSDFFVVDSSCTDTQCLGYPEVGYTKNVYNRNASSTFKTDGDQKFTIKFGSDDCSGSVLIDRLTLADYTYDNQTFGAASSVPGVFGYVPFDGVLGLGLTPSKDNGIKSIVDNLLDQFPEKLFTVWLDRNTKPNAKELGGLITFGSTDEINCDPQIIYVPLTSKAFWQFAIDKFAFDSYVSQKSTQAISDTATVSIVAPSIVLRSIIKTLHAEYDSMYQFYTVPCDLVEGAPRMLFTIGGSELFVEGPEYLIDIGLDDGKCAVALFDIDDTSFEVDWIVGAPFIRAYCNIYSIGDNQIGFARAKHN